MGRPAHRSLRGVAARSRWLVALALLTPIALDPAFAFAAPTPSGSSHGAASHQSAHVDHGATHPPSHSSAAPSAVSIGASTTAPSLAPAGSRPLVTPSARMQRAVAGAPSPSETSAGPESPELAAMREAELDLFVGAAPPISGTWPSELPVPPKGPLASSGAGGLPPAPVAAPPMPPSLASPSGKSLAWLADLKMPDIPVRWDARVLSYLEFFKNDPRGRRIFSAWWRRSGRWRVLVQQQLRARSMPEDLVYVAMAESGFDPLIRSAAGAVGLWQLLPDPARPYGLSIDRWADQRLSPLRSTEAAAYFLADLKRRFGTWELALAAYNMGYGGALASVKRFDTNDYWQLSRFEGALPWETTHYVPKIIALAVVGRNLEAFGFESLQAEAPAQGEIVEVPAGAELRAITAVAGCTVRELELLNPELRAGRTPVAGPDAKPEDATYAMLVPKGKASAVRDGIAKLAPSFSIGKSGPIERYVVRFGESLDQIAATRKTTKQKLVELNAIGEGESIRGGTVLLVPVLPPGAVAPTGAFAGVQTLDGKPLVLVPGVPFHYRDRERVFYRVIVGDTVRAIADAFDVPLDDLRRWNTVDMAARLQEGMTLQLFVRKTTDLSRVVCWRDGQARILAVGSDDFYAWEEAQKGRKRLTVIAKKGETIESIGKRYSISAASMERINRRPRSDVLKAGESVTVYVALGKGEAVKLAPEPTIAPAIPATPEPMRPVEDVPLVEETTVPASSAAPTSSPSPAPTPSVSASPTPTTVPTDP